MTVSEFLIIDKFLKPIATKTSESFGLRDDAAVFSVADGYQNVISKDVFTQNVHFTIEERPRDIAKRLLMTNISDIASCGALPKRYLLGLPIHDSLNEDFYADFCAGLKEINDLYDINLVGGDSFKVANDLFFSLSIIGESNSQILQRSGAQHGDLVFVTGQIGDAFLHLKSRFDSDFSFFSANDLAYLQNKFYYKLIPVDFMNLLSKSGYSRCATDVSDGLVADLVNICQASDFSMHVDFASVAISEIAKTTIDKGLVTIEDLLTAGDDYELIFTAKEEFKKDIFMLANRFNVGLNIIGRVIEKKESPLFDFNGDNIKLKNNGYEH